MIIYTPTHTQACTQTDTLIHKHTHTHTPALFDPGYRDVS